MASVYARALEIINEFLPSQGMAGRFVVVPVEFGLIEKEKLAWMFEVMDHRNR